MQTTLTNTNSNYNRRMMQTILVKQYIDQYGDYSQSGSAVYDFASAAISKGDTLRFDMSGQDSVSTVFLNASFGKLIDTFGIDKVKRSFVFVNLLRSQIDRIRKYFDDYKELYS